MANIVIITKQCYLLCEAINYIAVNEVRDDDAMDAFDRVMRKRAARKSGRKRSLAPKKPTALERRIAETTQYQIIIDFIPVAGKHSPNIKSNGVTPESASVGFTVTGRKTCLELFSHMVEQLREQIPDHMYLDKLVEKFLSEAMDGSAV